jgi:hypothetical protein
MNAIKIDKICIALLAKGVKRLKEDIKYLNEDRSLDIYTHVEAILNDTEGSPEKKLQFFYDELFRMYGKKRNIENVNIKKAA